MLLNDFIPKILFPKLKGVGQMSLNLLNGHLHTIYNNFYVEQCVHICEHTATKMEQNHHNKQDYSKESMTVE